MSQIEDVFEGAAAVLATGIGFTRRSSTEEKERRTTNTVLVCFLYMTWVEIASVISSLATALAAIAVVVTALIYYGQLKAMTKGRELESVLAIMSYANDLELRKARYLMLEHEQDLKLIFEKQFSNTTRHQADKKIRQLSSNEVTLHGVDLALNSLNNVSYLIRYGYAPEEAADALLKNTLRRSWIAFQTYIDYRRRRPDDSGGGMSPYAEHFEWVIKEKYGELSSSPDEGRELISSNIASHVEVPPKNKVPPTP